MVNADIEIMDSFSAHADRNEIVDFLANQKGRLKKIFLVHGEIDRQEALREWLAPHGFDQVAIPALGQSFTLE